VTEAIAILLFDCMSRKNNFHTMPGIVLVYFFVFCSDSKSGLSLDTTWKIHSILNSDPETLQLRRFEQMVRDDQHYFFSIWNEFEELIDYLFNNENRKAESCIPLPGTVSQRNRAPAEKGPVSYLHR